MKLKGFRWWVLRKFFHPEVLLIIQKARKEGWNDGFSRGFSGGADAAEYVAEMLDELRKPAPPLVGKSPIQQHRDARSRTQHPGGGGL